MVLTPEIVRAALTRSIVRVAGTQGMGERDAAVVVPIRFGLAPSAIAVLRAADLAEHAGEVAFPGGKPEPGDADLRATALRETEEEVAIRAAHVEILGALSPIPVISGRYLIHPFVAAVPADVEPSPQAGEIARVLDVPILPWITGHRTIRGVEGEFRGAFMVAPHFELDGCVLYGASAFIFYELLAKLAAELGRDLPAPVLQVELPWADRDARRGA